MSNFITNNKGIFHNEITDGTKTVDIFNIDGKDRLAVNAGSVQISAQGTEGSLFHKTATSSFGAQETKELISQVITTGKKVFVKGFGGSADRAGNTNSLYILINKQGDTTEVEKDRFYTTNAIQRLYLRALEFNAGDRLIVRVSNNAGANANHEVSINGAEVNV